MKKLLKYIVAILLLATTLLFSCEKEAALTATDLVEKYPITQGNSEADLFRFNFFNRYQSKILFEFDKMEYWYTASGNANDSVDYFIKITAPDKQKRALEFMNAQWLSFYPQEFKRKTLPQYILAVDRLYDYPSTSITATPNSTRNFKTNGFNNIMVTTMGDRFDALTDNDKITLRNDINFGYLYNWIYLRNKLFFPKEFYDVSLLKYGVSPRDPAVIVANNYDDYLNNGFMPPVVATYPGTGSSISTSRYQSQDEDVAQFLRLLIQKDDAFVNTLINNPLAPKVKQKYLILLNFFTSKGINIRDINTKNVATLGPLNPY